MVEIAMEDNKDAIKIDSSSYQNNNPVEIFGFSKEENHEAAMDEEQTEAAMGEDSISQNKSPIEPVEIAVSWDFPQSDEGCSSQSVKIDVMNSEEVENQLVSPKEDQNQLVSLQDDQNQLVSPQEDQNLSISPMEDQNQVVSPEGDENALSIDLTTYFTTDQVFDTRLELTNWCQEVGRKVMTVVVITKSEHSIKGRKPRLFLGCERGGVFRDHKKKSDLVGRQIRRTGTKRCGCPFVLKGVKQNEGDKWKLEVRCGIHNHPISRTSVGHSYAGRLSKEEKQLVLDMSMSGVRPKEVLTTIRERNSESVSTMTTIYNARAKLRTPNLEGRTAMQHLMKLLLKNRYYEWHRKNDETNEVRDIFWAHPESLHLAKCFPSVLMIDCTYKVNRFKIPLFEILGTTCTGKTFCIAFFFMEVESEDNYLWAMYRLRNIFDPKSLPRVFVTDRELTLMKAISTVFPTAYHLMCPFNISKDITTHCKQQFETDQEFNNFLEDWTNLIRTESQIEFVDKLTTFEMTWANFPDCLAYLRENWLSDYMEDFVVAWTNLVKHYGNTSISRNENAHSKLKVYLSSSQGNLTTIWNIMQNMINAEIADVKASFQKSLTTVQLPHQVDPLNDLRGFVSHLALDLIVAEISRSESIDIDTLTCGCVLRQTHGLPCAHEILQFTHEGVSIPLSAVDSHWKWLSSIPPAEIYSELDYKPEYQELVRRWEESNEEQRMRLLKKIKELANPDSTWFDESDAMITNGVPRKLSRNSLSTC